jgi:hypothetical protein
MHCCGYSFLLAICAVVAIHFSSFAPLFTVLVAKYVFSLFQYCLENHANSYCHNGQGVVAAAAVVVVVIFVIGCSSSFCYVVFSGNTTI